MTPRARTAAAEADAGDVSGVLAEAGLEATAEQAAALAHHLHLLQRWNAVYNLTAVRDPAAMLVQHIADSLSLVRPLRREVEASGIAHPHVLDVGSGGGLPALPLAILQPAWQVTCVEPVGKKVAFLRQAAAECGLANVEALERRAEDLAASPTHHWVTSRAFSRLRKLVDCTRHLLAEGGGWVAMKGAVPTDEMAEVAPVARVFHVEQLHVPRLAASRCLVWMRPVNG